jgi:hypothetical protein
MRYREINVPYYAGHSMFYRQIALASDTPLSKGPSMAHSIKIITIITFAALMTITSVLPAGAQAPTVCLGDCFCSVAPGGQICTPKTTATTLPPPSPAQFASTPFTSTPFVNSAAPVAPAASSGWRTVSDRGYSYSIPASWYAKPSGQAGLSGEYSSSPAGAFAFVGTLDARDASPQSFLRSLIRSNATEYTDGTATSIDSFSVPGSTDAAFVVMSHTSDAGNRWLLVNLAAQAPSGRIYILLIDGLEDWWTANFDSVVLPMIGSFRVS